MSTKTGHEAVLEALQEELHRDDEVFVYGGVYQSVGELKDEFGEDRIFNAPLSETATAGTAVGAALSGARPVIEITYADFMAIPADHLINTGPKGHFCYSGDTSVPMVVRAPYGGQNGAYHSQSVEGWFQNVPGLKIVMPSTQAEYKGLLKSAVRDDDPVMFLQHRDHMAESGEVPDDDYTTPIGEADVKREGSDVTIVAYGKLVDHAKTAADELAEEGIEAEIVDPRTLVPLDIDPILESVDKTGKLVIAHLAPKFGGFGGEIGSLVLEKGYDSLDAPLKRVGGPFSPIPYAENLSEEWHPNEEEILEAVHEIV